MILLLPHLGGLWQNRERDLVIEKFEEVKRRIEDRTQTAQTSHLKESACVYEFIYACVSVHM